MNNRRRIVVALVLFTAVFVIGVVGFKIIGGSRASVLDAVYMTAITISTIGYGEVIDLSHHPAGRVFAVLFIVLSLGTIAYAVSSITAFIVEGELKNLLGRRRMEKDIAKLRDHYIVCGSDETAGTIIRELLRTRRDFVVVEPDKEKLEKLRAQGDFLFVQDDPAEDQALRRAGIDRARGVFPCLPSDEANVFVTITARGLNPGLRIVAKGIDPRSHEKMRKAGADAVISPAFIGGMRMASEMVRPAVVSFLDMMLRDQEKGLRVEELEVMTGSPLVGQTIREARLGEKTGALLVAVRNERSTEYEFNPPADRRIKEKDILIFIGTPEMSASLRRIAGQD